MDDTAAIEAITYEDFETYSRRLGWLSTTSRRVLLARYFARNLGLLKFVLEDESSKREEVENYILQIFRAVSNGLLPGYIGSAAFSSPYNPPDRPTEYFLAFSRGAKLAALMIEQDEGLNGSKIAWLFDSARPQAFIYDSSDGKPHIHEQLFAYELREATRNTNLTTKHVVDSRCIELSNCSIWQENIDEASVRSVMELFDTLSMNSAGTWDYWLLWYNALLAGQPLDNELQEAVLNISEDVWERGAEAVAEEIRAIQRKSKTNVAPQLIEVSEGLWGVENDTRIAKEPFAFAIMQVEVALSAALASGQNNGLSETSGETILIRAACGPYRESPSVVATSFWNACMSLQRNIGDVYPEDSLLVALQNTLYTSVGELCEQDYMIQTRIGKLAALETRRHPTPAEKMELAKVSEAVVENTTKEVQEQLQDMVDIVVSEQKPPRITRARLVNWITTLGVGIDKAQKGEKRTKWLLDLARRIGAWFFKDDEPGA